MKRLAILLALFATAAYGDIFGTLGWVPPNDGVTFTGATLGSATSVTIPTPESVNALPPLFQGQANQFLPLVTLASNVVIANLTLPVTNLNGGFFAALLPDYSEFGPSDRFEFSGAEIEWTSSASTNLSVLATGTLIDTVGVFSPTVADISGSFTTTGRGTVNASFTLTTSGAVPEPASLILFGTLVSLIGIGWRRRRQ